VHRVSPAAKRYFRSCASHGHGHLFCLRLEQYSVAPPDRSASQNSRASPSHRSRGRLGNLTPFHMVPLGVGAPGARKPSARGRCQMPLHHRPSRVRQGSEPWAGGRRFLELPCVTQQGTGRVQTSRARSRSSGMARLPPPGGQRGFRVPIAHPPPRWIRRRRQATETRVRAGRSRRRGRQVTRCAFPPAPLPPA
jgi:hypothetical protein